MENLKLNQTYLLQFGSGDMLFSVTILIVTDKAYHVQWNRGVESDYTWEQKKVLNKNYCVIENITDFVNVENKPKQKLIQCYVCKGSGNVPDGKSTNLSIKCPLCSGSKMIPEN